MIHTYVEAKCLNMPKGSGHIGSTVYFWRHRERWGERRSLF